MTTRPPTITRPGGSSKSGQGSASRSNGSRQMQTSGEFGSNVDFRLKSSAAADRLKRLHANDGEEQASFGGGDLLRSKHIDTLEVLAEYSKANETLKKENETLRSRLSNSSGSTLDRVKELEMKLAESQARAVEYYCKLQEIQENHNTTMAMVRDQKLKVAKLTKSPDSQEGNDTLPSSKEPTAAEQMAKAMLVWQQRADELHDKLKERNAAIHQLELKEETNGDSVRKLQEEIVRERFNRNQEQQSSRVEIQRLQESIRHLTCTNDELQKQNKSLEHASNSLRTKCDQLTEDAFRTASDLAVLRKEHECLLATNDKLQLDNAELAREASQTAVELQKTAADLALLQDTIANSGIPVTQGEAAVRPAPSEAAQNLDQNMKYRFSELMQLRRENERLELLLARTKSDLQKLLQSSRTPARSPPPGHVGPFIERITPKPQPRDARIAGTTPSAKVSKSVSNISNQ